MDIIFLVKNHSNTFSPCYMRISRVHTSFAAAAAAAAAADGGGGGAAAADDDTDAAAAEAVTPLLGNP